MLLGTLRQANKVRMVEVPTVYEFLIKAPSAFTSAVSTIRPNFAGMENVVSQIGEMTNRYQGIRHFIAYVAESIDFIKWKKCIDLTDLCGRNQYNHHTQVSLYVSSYHFSRLYQICQICQVYQMCHCCELFE